MQSGKVHMKGSFAWMIWAIVHILSLAQPGLRISVFVQWMWTLLSRQPGSRLIVNYRAPARETATSDGETEVEPVIGQSSAR
jgi:NADH:ubiquinone reductase (H+-translocating)